MSTEFISSRPTDDVPRNIPGVSGTISAAYSWRHGHEGTNLTDRMGVMGACLVFPEFTPVASDLQLVVTLAHSIDHISDEGPDHRRLVGGKTNAEYAAILTEKFHTHYGETKHDDLRESTFGFLSHAVRVERAAHEGQYDSSEGQVAYRELINAIYTRMLVSFGNKLLHPIADVDPIVMQTDSADPIELGRAYEDYQLGNNLGDVPQGAKSYALYLWTVIVQQQFDILSLKDNQRKGLVSFRQASQNYTGRAVEACVRPLALSAAKLAVSSMIYSKRAAIHTLPRYRNERLSKGGNNSRTL